MSAITPTEDRDRSGRLQHLLRQQGNSPSNTRLMFLHNILCRSLITFTMFTTNKRGLRIDDVQIEDF